MAEREAAPPHSQSTMPRPRILFHLTHFLRGGIETSLVSLLNSLAGEHFEVGLTVTFPTEALENHFRARISPQVRIHVLGPEAWLSRTRQLKKERKLGPLGKICEDLLLPPIRKPIFNRRFRRIAADYDVVVDYDMSLSRLTGPLPVPMMGYSHFSVAHLERGHGRKLRKLRRQCREHYDRIVVLNDTMLRDARALIPEAADKFVRLYNAIDLQHIRALAAQPFDAPPGPYIVSVGRLEESQKDFTTLLKAYAQLVERTGAPERLVVVGEGASRKALEALARDLGLAGRVSFVGFQANPYVWIRHASLMAYSSKMEGLPNVLLEGMAVGQLVISTDCPVGPREILDEGRAGMLTPVGDVAALADAMERGLRDEALRQQLLTYAATHIAQMGFGPTARAFSACVADLLSERSPVPDAADARA
jgi:glycosyltransferase involved in cell wall biosynthesis